MRAFIKLTKTPTINYCKTTSQNGTKNLELLENKIRKKTQMKKEFNTESVIEWFESIKSKSKRSYVTFAIADFHPSIIKELLSKTIKYA